MSARPRVTLKLATSLDGRIALADGRSKWITGPRAREAVHAMRANHDAVLTGIGTVLADDPQLTARPGDILAASQPLRVVLDSQLRTPASSQLLAAGPALLIHGPGADRTKLGDTGAEFLEVGRAADGQLDIVAALDDLSKRSIASVMIEAGGLVAGSVLRANLVDEIVWFRAPKLIGAEGRACVADLALESLDAAPIFTRTEVRDIGADLIERYERR